MSSSIEDRSVELAEDNWIVIFSFLSTPTKLKISQVCKQWRALIMHPSFWKAVEVRLGRSRSLGLAVQYQRLIDFITKYCPVIVDLHITILSHQDLPENWLNPVFQSKTLQRLAVVMRDYEHASSNLVYRMTLRPASEDLKLVNLASVKLDKNTVELLLQLPNLEELYLHCNTQLAENSLKQARKLQILYASQDIVRSSAIVAACPSLKYLICHVLGYDDDEDDDWREDERTISKIENTIVVTDNTLDLLEIDPNAQINFNRVAPLVMPYTCGLVENVLVPMSCKFNSLQPYIESFVKELNFDLNSAYASQCLYRPSFTFSARHTRMCFGSNYIQPEYLEKYPIEATITQGDLKIVEEIIKLGAWVECPEPNRSYLTIAYRADIRLLLLQHGADPNKNIDAKEYLPVFAYMFMDPRFEDSAEVVRALQDKCDLSVKILGKSLLHWAISNQKWESFDALMAHGLQLSQKDQLHLLKRNPPLFVEMILNKTLDMMQFDTKVAIEMIHMDLAPLIAPYMNENMNKLDECGYTLFHYMCLTGKDDQFSFLEEPELFEGEKYRWKLADPENCSWRSSQQKVKDIRNENESEQTDQNETIIHQAYIYESNEDKEQSIYEKLRLKQFQRSPKKPKPKFTIQNLPPVTIVNPDVAILTKDNETGLLLVCKSSFTPEEMMRRVKEHLSFGADFNLPDKFGWTPLHALCYGQYWQVACLLLENGANINVQDNHGVTPFMAAIYGYKRLADRAENPSSFTEHFLSLMKATKESITSIDATEKFSNRTLLHLAVSVNDKHLISALLKTKLDINARDADGFTPLHHAVMYGHNGAVETLVKNGADLNAQTTSLRLTPAMVLMQILSVFKTSKYADNVPPNVPYFKYLESYNTITRVRQCWRDVDDLKVNVELCDAPWHHSDLWFHGSSFETLTNCDEMLELLTSKANLTLTDINRNTYLHFLIILYGDNFSGLNEWLVKHEELNSQWNEKNDSNTSSFHSLCSQLDRTKVYSASEEAFLYDLVTKYNIDIMARGSSGKFPLYFIASAKWSSFSWDKWTALQGVDLSVELPEPHVPDFFEVLWSEKRVSLTMLKDILAKNPAYLERRDQNGETFLIRLIRQIVAGDLKLDVLEVILAYTSHLNIQDVNGNTALHIACQFFHLGAVDSIRSHLDNVHKSYLFFATPFILLDAGADPYIKNNRGETPLSYVPALMSHYQHLYKWIKSAAERALDMEREYGMEVD